MTENASSAPMNLDETETVRLAVYHGFARTGQAPGVPGLAALTGLAPDRVRQELRTLHASHDLVLDPPAVRPATPRTPGWWAGRRPRRAARWPISSSL